MTEIDMPALLLAMPDKIREASSKISVDTCELEKIRASIEDKKNDAFGLVLVATEGGKPKYTNDNARKIALQFLLKEDGTYLAAVDEAGLLESQVRREEVELAYLQNMFRAYLAIAGMQGVR